MLVCVSEILHSVQDDKMKVGFYFESAPFHNGDKGRPDSFGAAFVVSVRSGMRKNLVLTDKTREKIWCSLTKREKKFGGTVYYLYIYV